MFNERMAIDSDDSDSPPASIHLTDIKQWSIALHSYHRPFLAHLNADTTWLIQLPYPASTKPPPGRTHFNILLDPWLQGPQSDVASWFSTQWHVIPSSVSTIENLNEALQEVEGRGSSGRYDGSFIDVVAISHEFTDHCHRATLQELPRDTPVFASDVAADLIRSWGHFDKVITQPALGRDVHWSKLAAVGGLPDWVAIGRVTTAGNSLYYHSAVLIAFDINVPRRNDKKALSRTAEAVLYSPHGIQSSDLSSLRSSDIDTLALLHGLHDVRIWMVKQLNLGALNGIKAAGVSGARYWISTHDEEKKGGGFIAPFLQRVRYTLKEAVQYEHEKMEKEEGTAPGYYFTELGSGDALVLE